VEKDIKKAVKWVRKAAAKGEARARYHLGVCYIEGLGVEKDAEEAARWYRKAAKQRSADEKADTAGKESGRQAQEKGSGSRWWWLLVPAGLIVAVIVLGRGASRPK
jgi:TPR repeat protein